MTTSARLLTLPILALALAGSPTLVPPAEAGVRVRIAPRPVIVVGASRPAKKVVVVRGVRMGTVDVNVKPKDTAVFVDGDYRGVAGKLDGTPGKLHLKPGKHRLKLVTPDGTVLEETIRVVAGHEIDVNLDLR